MSVYVDSGVLFVTADSRQHAVARHAGLKTRRLSSAA